KEALHYFDKAIRTLEGARKHSGREVTGQEFLRNTHWFRAQALSVLQKPAEAVQDWDRALALEQGPLRSLIRLGRAANLVQLGQHARAAAEVEDILQATKLNAGATYDAACVFALAAAKAKEPA